jgi:hypothetical protein
LPIINISHTVGIYLINPESRVYKAHSVNRLLTRLLAGIKQPHEIRKIHLDNPLRVQLVDLQPITRNLNIVIIPTRTYHFDLWVHSDTITIVISLVPGNPKYSHGLYVSMLTLVHRYLGGTPLEIKRGSLYFRLKPAGKAIIIACMTSVKNAQVFTELIYPVNNIKLAQRPALIKVLRLKRKLYKLHNGGNRGRHNMSNMS